MKKFEKRISDKSESTELSEESKELVEEMKEDKEETEQKKKDKSYNNIGSELLSCLFNKRTQFHIWHLQTESYSEHKLLQELYEGILDLADSILEQYQGKYGRIYGFQSCECMDYCNTDKIKKYLMDFCYKVKYWKQQLDIDSNLNNLFDELIGLINSSIYKLTLK